MVRIISLEDMMIENKLEELEWQKHLNMKQIENLEDMNEEINLRIDKLKEGLEK